MLALAAGNPAVAGAALLLSLAAGAALYLPVLGLAVLILTAPLTLSVQVGPTAVPLVQATMILVLVAIAVVRLVLDSGLAIRADGLDLAVLGFLAASGISLLALRPGSNQVVAGYITALLGAVVFFLARHTVTKLTDVNVLVLAVMGYGLLQTAGIAIAVLDGSLGVSEATRASASLVDPNHLAGAIVLVLPLLVAIGLARPQNWMLVATTLATLALCAALVATLSRSGWLGLLSGGLVLIILMPQRRRQLALLGAAVALVLLAAGLAMPIGLRLAPHATGPVEMLASRERVWGAAVAMIHDHPLFGVGIGNFEALYPSYATRPFAAAHAHNLLLNLAAERGLAALAAFLLVLTLVGASLRRAWRRVRDLSERALVAGLAASLTAYLVHSLFEVSYDNATILLLFWLVAGAAGALPHAFADPELETPSSSRRRMIIAPQ